MKKKLIIFGAGEFARLMNYYLERDDRYSVEYFCVSSDAFNTKVFLEKRVLNFEQDLDKISKDEYQFVLAIGYSNLRKRKIFFDAIKNKGYNFINYIHPSVINYGEISGEGNIIFPNVLIEPFCEINNNNVVWSSNVVLHDSIIGNHNFIAANCLIGGRSKVLDNNFLGFNSTIIQDITINKEVLIGAKSLVLKSTDDFSAYYGIPAKKIREHYKNGIIIT